MVVDSVVSRVKDRFHSGSSMMHERPRFSYEVKVFDGSPSNVEFIFSQWVKTGVTRMGRRFFPDLEDDSQT